MLTRAAFLKSRTASAHAALDARIMELGPFASIDGYTRFLQAQLGFHREVEPLYGEPQTARIVPDRASGSRVQRIEADMRALGMEPPRCVTEPAVRSHAEAVGWLYVAEGSKLGAAILLRSASKLGLDMRFGASHLAGHPDGRGYEWRLFTSALNALSLSHDEDAQAAEGAAAAFRSFANHLELGFRNQNHAFRDVAGATAPLVSR
jgi:heme oxygenase